MHLARAVNRRFCSEGINNPFLCIEERPMKIMTIESTPLDLTTLTMFPGFHLVAYFFSFF